MKFNVLEEANAAEAQNFKNIDERLNDTKNTIENCIKLTLEDISSNPICEDKYVELWAKSLKDISNYFFEASENSGNKRIYKKVFKQMIFK